MDICAICLEHTYNYSYKAICCKNKFHFECLDKWFKIKNTCPLCREEYSHMEDYTCDMEDYLETFKKIDIKNVVTNLSNTIVIYKIQMEEFNSPFLSNLLTKTELFLNVIQDFYKSQ